MIVFSIILTAISSAIMIAMGYTFPYIVLWYYAMKRKTTVKSLFSQIKEHGDLLCAFATSIFYGYCTCGSYAFRASESYIIIY